ncbi:MAG: Nif3-like dinuclear metal center hexameric protein [Spirochaetaceae bacterium]|nr:Nif3-like dinuclear metal center hexameric protein [Spirochaetaceae bacterium]
MKLQQLDKELKTLFEAEKFSYDPSLNGIQLGDTKANITKVAFALDVSAAAINLAVKQQANLLFVHHGLFWGEPSKAISGSYYNNIKKLIENNIALYAMHLPLDAHPIFGNNMTVANRAGLSDIEVIDGIGFGGKLEKPANVLELAAKVYGSEGVTIWPFKEEVTKIAVIVGGATTIFQKVYGLGYEAIITGEVKHSLYHFCAENNFSVMAGGHYQSEMPGLIAFKNYFTNHFNLETTLIDLPTGC